MNLRWNAVLFVSIFFIAIAFVAGVLVLAGPHGGSTGQAPTGKTQVVTKTKILSTSAGALLPAGLSGGSTGLAETGKTIAPEKKILSRASEAAQVQEIMKMQPSEPNMTVIAKTGGNLSYSISKVEVVVTNPPLLIDLTVIPKTVTDTKWYVNRSLTRNEEIIQVSGTSPYSFADVSVIDKETGRIVAQEGFGRDDSIDPTRAIKVYEPGKYLVQLYGNEVAVQALLSTRTL
jgi:hypothetical protein